MYQKIKWVVIKWKNIGNKIWFPTANIFCKKWIIYDWVYKINIIYNNNIYRWVWMYNEEIEIFEAYFFNFNKSIYNKNIQIIIHEKIRDNKKFDSLNDLVKQIKKDIKQVKSSKSYVLTFWTFDFIHPWHSYYLLNAKSYWDILVTIVATDQNVEKIKWKKTVNNSNKRLQDLKLLNISDEIVLWKNDNHMFWVEKYKPQVICLWYDQIWFSTKLENYILVNKLNIKIIRIAPYKENIYKSSIIKKNHL